MVPEDCVPLRNTSWNFSDTLPGAKVNVERRLPFLLRSDVVKVSDLPLLLPTTPLLPLVDTHLFERSS